MKFYRIKQIDEKTFIPQIAPTIADFILGNWDGIDLGFGYDWSSGECQKQHCSQPTLEDACRVVEQRKQKEKKLKNYPKYHKPCSVK